MQYSLPSEMSRRFRLVPDLSWLVLSPLFALTCCDLTLKRAFALSALCRGSTVLLAFVPRESSIPGWSGSDESLDESVSRSAPLECSLSDDDEPDVDDSTSGGGPSSDNSVPSFLVVFVS